MRFLIQRLWLGALALVIVGCSTQSGGGGSLKPGMTVDQTVAAMGQPDLKDDIPDANHSGPALLRYTWLNAGEAAVFSPDGRVANVVNVGSSPSTLTEATQEQVQRPFDPIQTPFDYAFYPFRAAVIVIFSGLNCIGGNGCHSPRLPPVVPG